MASQTAAKSSKKTKRIPFSTLAFLLMSTSFFGQILGFLRTKLVNANFPVTGPNSTGSYFAAFDIPDFFFFTLAAGALGVAFMPVLADRLAKGDRKGVWDLSGSLMNLLAIVMFVAGVFILIFARPLIHYVVAPDLTPGQLHNAVTIMRLLAFDPLLFTLSGVLTATQQSLGRFFFYAIAPLFYNLSIIASIFLFRHSLGLIGLGIGALVGSILQLVVVVFGLFKIRFRWRPRILWRNAEFRSILRNLPPRSFDQGLDQVESIVETNVASHLGTQYISYYNNAYILQTAPTLLIGAAISTAAFPRLNDRLSQGRPDLFRRDFLRILRAMIWITMPIVVICYFGRGYLARMIFSKDASEIALIFGFLAVAILFNTLYTIISRWFYSNKDTKTPLFVSIFTIGLNVILAVTLSRPTAYGATGLAIAQSLVAMIQVLVLFTIMLIRDHKLFDMQFFGGCARIVSVTGFSVFAASTVVAFLPLEATDRGIITLGSKLFFISLVVFAVHVGVSAIFGLDEVEPLFRRVKAVVLKPIHM